MTLKCAMLTRKVWCSQPQALLVLRCERDWFNFFRPQKSDFTVDTLPPDHYACEAQEEENAPNDRLPLCCLLLHLWVGLAERQPIHCSRGGGG